MWTLSALQMHPHSMVVCDEDATLELQVKTVKVGSRYSFSLHLTNLDKYFKSIEIVASKLGFSQAIPIAVQKGTPVTEENLGRKKLDMEIKENQEAARREFAVVSQKHELAPPVTPLPRAITPELTPDCMASRIPGLLERTQHSLISDEFSFDRMGGRVGSHVVV